LRERPDDRTSSLPADEDGVCLLQQYAEQLTEFKTEFSDIRQILLTFDVDDGSELGIPLTHVERGLLIALWLSRRYYVHMSLPQLQGVSFPNWTYLHLMGTY